jgi:predicted acetyltransferase
LKVFPGALPLPYLLVGFIFQRLLLLSDPDNIASQRVIEANGGILIEHFIKPQQFGCKPGLRFRITFT